MRDKKPVRVQMSRKKGWRLPENTVSVARPTKWGNPFKIGMTHVENDGLIEVPNAKVAVRLYRDWIGAKLDADVMLHRMLVQTELRKLRGKNLACWCPLDQPCHADVLLELANKEPNHDR